VWGGCGMILSNPPARLGAGQADRIELELKQSCYCDGENARLCVRQQGANKVIRLQCETCGRGIGGALPTALHPYAAEYPAWDENLQTAHQAKSQGALSERQLAWRAQQASDRAAKSADYAAWLANSVSWQGLRAKVMRRANLLCEACLAAPAIDVHHLTYDFGKLPPAWELRAVCRPCHNRLHAGWHDGAPG
jgi:5-methylcytosine-specific restriction endonuclease McrA